MRRMDVLSMCTNMVLMPQRPGSILCVHTAVSAALVTGLFVPKPSRHADCQRCGVSDLRATVR
jgi:hypothetical protein